jgi:hypothetical protein
LSALDSLSHGASGIGLEVSLGCGFCAGASAVAIEADKKRRTNLAQPADRRFGQCAPGFGVFDLVADH